MARCLAWARKVRKRSMPATPSSEPMRAQAHRGRIEARREEAGRAVRTRHARTRPAIPASAWRRRKTETSGAIPASARRRATDSVVDPRDSRAAALMRRAQVVRGEGASSLTRPWATRAAKEGRRVHHAAHTKAIPPAARIPTVTSRTRTIQGLTMHLPGCVDRC